MVRWSISDFLWPGSGVDVIWTSNGFWPTFMTRPPNMGFAYIYVIGYSKTLLCDDPSQVRQSRKFHEAFSQLAYQIFQGSRSSVTMPSSTGMPERLRMYLANSQGAVWSAIAWDLKSRDLGCPSHNGQARNPLPVICHPRLEQRDRNRHRETPMDHVGASSSNCATFM